MIHECIILKPVAHCKNESWKYYCTLSFNSFANV